MGPMRAAQRFVLELARAGLLHRAASVQADLYGSLALTGVGHGTDRAVLLGLSGEEASRIDPATIEPKLAAIRETGTLSLLGERAIPFREAEQLIFHRNQMYPPGAKTEHPNGVRFTAYDANGLVLHTGTFFSIGGGFIVADSEDAGDAPVMTIGEAPYPFHSAAELVEMAARDGLAIWQVMLRNECTFRDEEKVRAGIRQIWSVMLACMDRGMTTEGILPGGLGVRRRAPQLAQRLREKASAGKGSGDPLAPLDWVTVYAMAVNEENAA